MQLRARISTITLIVLGVGVLAATLSIPVTPAGVNKMNVIVISVDSLRTDHMGLYGYTRDTTPQIDAWAKGAMVFDNYFSTSYLTPISEMSVQTGDYPATNGIINFESQLHPAINTLAEILQQQGWRTAAFGSSPEYSGPTLKLGFSRGFDTYQPTVGGSDQYNGRGNDPVGQSLSWLKQNGGDGRPFYLWLSLGSAHWPYGQGEPPHFTDPSYAGFLKKFVAPQWEPYGYMYQGKGYHLDTKTGKVTFAQDITAADMAYVIGRYDDGILMTDRMLGNLFAYLKESGLDKKTVVVLESEHGEDLGERGYVAHYDIYDEQVHTPLIIKAPDLSHGRVSGLASGVDVLPTLLNMLRVSAPQVDGVSLLPHLTQFLAPTPRNEVYLMRTSLWERVIEDQYSNSQLQHFLQADNQNHYYDTAVRTEDWKLIHRLSRDAQARWSWWGILTGTTITLPEYELYDMKRDPQEQQNVYDTHKNDATITELQKKLTVWESSIQQELATSTQETEKVQPYF